MEESMEWVITNMDNLVVEQNHMNINQPWSDS